MKEALPAHGIESLLLSDRKSEAIRALEDGGGAKALAGNPISSSNEKHIDIRQKILGELVGKKKDRAGTCGQ